MDKPRLRTKVDMPPAVQETRKNGKGSNLSGRKGLYLFVLTVVYKMALHVPQTRLNANYTAHCRPCRAWNRVGPLLDGCVLAQASPGLIEDKHVL